MRELKIGRAKDNDIFIDDNSVSRYHAVLVLSDDEFVIVDNNATNGTFVNALIYHLGDKASSLLLDNGHTIC